MEKPRFFGRLLRIAFGVVTLAALFFVDAFGVLGQLGRAVLGVSFLVGGIIGNPGGEITALPNLIFRKRCHCF